MFPHEAQVIMAKIMFIIFATIMLCMNSRAHTLHFDDLDVREKNEVISLI